MDKRRPIILNHAFYSGPDVTLLARQLLGKYLFTVLDGHHTGGMVIETEAYAGIHDRASHAWGGRRTKRTGIMYSGGGVAYVYLCYGIHSLFNIVTNAKDIPDAILIRGIYPTHGLPVMEQRLKRSIPSDGSLQGPGLVSKAMGISTDLSGLPLNKNTYGPSIWLEDRGISVPDDAIITTPRIGVDYAGEDAVLPYRYMMAIKKS